MKEACVTLGVPGDRNMGHLPFGAGGGHCVGREAFDWPSEWSSQVGGLL
jgi:hypothetical protein